MPSGIKTGRGHGPGLCECVKHQTRNTLYRDDFRTLHGDGPYPCGTKKMGCGLPVTFAEAIIDHVDEDHWNNDPDNWQPMHKRCHDRKSALCRTVNEANAAIMNMHPNNSREARAERARKQHARRRMDDPKAARQ